MRTRLRVNQGACVNEEWLSHPRGSNRHAPRGASALLRETSALDDATVLKGLSNKLKVNGKRRTT